MPVGYVSFWWFILWKGNDSYQCHLDLSISNGIFGYLEESEKALMTVLDSLVYKFGMKYWEHQN